ncbi:uncharacterized protein LOC144450902 isoform X2 [Glandiceps talaboti]
MPKSSSSLELQRESRERVGLPSAACSLPDIRQERRAAVEITDRLGAGLTPYRLPKLVTDDASDVTPRTKQEELYKIDADDQRSEHLVQYVRHKRKMLQPPHTIAQLHRASNLMVPNFRSARLAPVTPHPSVTASSELEYTHRYRGALPRLRGAESVNSFERKLDEEILRDNKRISWKLSHNNSSFDSKAGNSFSGPYSREFTIHCTAPHRWLKMKLLRREDTTLR